MPLGNEQFRDLFEAVADAIIVVDEDQRIVVVNEQAEATFGYPRAEMIGQPLTMLLPPRFRTPYRARYQDFMEGEEARRLMSERTELTGMHRSGDEFPVEITISKLRLDDRDFAFAIARDTTERHATEQALGETARLEELVRSKDEFIAAISHEIRTPLTVIVGFARLLHDEAANLPDDERAEISAMLVAQSIELTNIVEDLITVAKNDLGKLKVVSVPVDLRAQAAQVLEMWDPEEIPQIDLSGPSVKCIGDPGRVRQVIRNLVTNALRYGGPQIDIRVGNHPSTGYVAVADNGPGIPEQDRERIFEAYQQAQTTPGVAAALGLGLSISLNLAHLMAGDLTYRYEDEESLFEFTLPLPKPTNNADTRPHA